jgi:hypothetical protein
MMSSNEPIECHICHKIFDHVRKFTGHLPNVNHKLSKSEYEKRFNVILPHRIGAWNTGLTKAINPILAKTGNKISTALKQGHAAGKIKNWTAGLTKETDARIKKASDKLKGHKIFIDPRILGDINKKRLEGKTWEEIHGNKVEERRAQVSGKNSFRWIPFEIRICACGCGKSLQVKENLKRRFIFAHNTRGVNNPNWCGGLDKQFYQGFTKALKKQVKERDCNKCAVCLVSEVKLDVHHIDYNKKNSVLENLITLCSRCHAQTNFNRDSWREFFKPIMENIYGSRI